MPNNLENLLESLLSGLDEDVKPGKILGVDEAAVPISWATKEKLALMVFKGKQYGRVDIVLYKPNLIEKEFDRSGVDLESVLSPNDGGSFICGYVSFENYSKGFKVISSTGADHGYGPMLYDIALSVIYPDYLMSDRGSVSKSAQNVWAYYFNNRSDVIHRRIPLKKSSDSFVLVPNLSGIFDQIDDIKEEMNMIDISGPPFDMLIPNKKYRGMTQTHYKASLKQEYDQLLKKYNDSIANNPLAYAYQIKNPKNFTSLLNNHQKFIQVMKKLGISKKDVEHELSVSGNIAATYKTGR